jgi:hypothetical protein
LERTQCLVEKFEWDSMLARAGGQEVPIP